MKILTQNGGAVLQTTEMMQAQLAEVGIKVEIDAKAEHGGLVRRRSQRSLQGDLA